MPIPPRIRQQMAQIERSHQLEQSQSERARFGRLKKKKKKR